MNGSEDDGLLRESGGDATLLANKHLQGFYCYSAAIEVHVRTEERYKRLMSHLRTALRGSRSHPLSACVLAESPHLCPVLTAILQLWLLKNMLAKPAHWRQTMLSRVSIAPLFAKFRLSDFGSSGITLLSFRMLS